MSNSVIISTQQHLFSRSLFQRGLRKSRLSLFVIAFCYIGSLITGCSSAWWKSEPKSPWLGPRIFAIGYSPSLSFSKNDTERPLVIPIEGLGLSGDSDYSVSVMLDATHPISPNDYTIRYPVSQPFGKEQTRLEVVINHDYLKLVETGDQLTVTVHISKRMPLTRVDEAIGILNSAQKQVLPLVEQLDQLMKVNLDRESLRKFSARIISAKFYTTYLIERLHAMSGRLALVVNDHEKDKPDPPPNKGGTDQTDSREEMFNKEMARWQSQRRSLESIATEMSLLNYQIDRMSFYIGNFNTAVTSLNPEELKASRLSEIGNLAEEFSSFKGELEILGALNEGLRTISNQELDHGSNIGKLYKIGEGSNLIPVVSSRDFTFYELDKYREGFLNARIRPDDISAFPLPADEVVDLFGHYIADNYFVVRLSLRNTDPKDKLVNTGMIRVTGRAMVEVTLDGVDKQGNEDEEQYAKTLRYTVPIEVTPHSKEQIYTVLDDTEVDSTRHFMFRTLEFAGALASGYTGSFIDSQTTLNAVNLYNGVVTPGLKKLWVDRYPGYKRNIVNYGMEDLVKVPSRGTTSHKFLFFPRSRIEAVVLDPNSYGNLAFSSHMERSVRLKLSEGGPLADELFDGNKVGFKQPDTYVIYLVFDNMDIPLDFITAPQDGNLATQAVDLDTKALAEIQFRKNMADFWNAGQVMPSDALGGLTYATWESVGNELSQLNKGDPHDPADLGERGTIKNVLYKEDAEKEKKDFDTALNSIEALHELLKVDGAWRGHLLDHAGTKVDDLQLHHKQLSRITKSLAGGSEPSQYRSTVNLIDLHLIVAEQRSGFYKALGRLLVYLNTPDLRYKDDAAPNAPRKPLLVLEQIANTDEGDLTPQQKDVARQVINEMKTKVKELGELRGEELRGTILADYDLFYQKPQNK